MFNHFHKHRTIDFLGIKNVTISENISEQNMNYYCRNPILVWRAARENTYTKRRFYRYVRQRQKNYLCLLQPQRPKRLPASTVGFISPLFASVTTTIKPNLFRHINKKICVKMCKLCKTV